MYFIIYWHTMEFVESRGLMTSLKSLHYFLTSWYLCFSHLRLSYHAIKLCVLFKTLVTVNRIVFSTQNYLNLVTQYFAFTRLRIIY